MFNQYTHSSSQLVITVTDGEILPTFPQPMVTVTIRENKPNPALVVDLNTIEELDGRDIMYHWVENIYSGKTIFYFDE